MRRSTCRPLHFMRNIIPILFVGMTALVGCHSSSRVPRPTAAPTMAAPPLFRPMLITTFGTNTSSDGAWRIGVLESSLEFSRSLAARGDGWTSSGWSTTSPQAWRAQPGWFVFIESESRVWAYDGDRDLLLQAHTSSGNNSSGATYSSSFPCAVPAEVLTRISEPARKAIKLQL